MLTDLALPPVSQRARVGRRVCTADQQRSEPDYLHNGCANRTQATHNQVVRAEAALNFVRHVSLVALVPVQRPETRQQLDVDGVAHEPHCDPRLPLRLRRHRFSSFSASSVLSLHSVADPTRSSDHQIDPTLTNRMNSPYAIVDNLSVITIQ